MLIEEDLVAYLKAQTGLQVAYLHNDVSQGKTRLWLGRSGQQADLLLDEPGYITTSFDIECHAVVETIAVQLASELKDLLHGFRGTIGTHTIFCAEIVDHSDDYTPRGLDDDDSNYSWAALSLDLIHAEP